MNKSKSTLIILGVLVVLGLMGIFWVKGQYNTMVTMDEDVKRSWSQVENQYQRRMDLIPNLVNTVKGYATHERETLEGVINARARATQVTINASNLDEASLQRFQATQGELSSALSRLMVSLERYPELKANEGFRELQVQLEGTENRIAVERKRFNETAQQYNTHIRQFPTTLVAGLTGFQQRPYFTADPTARTAPTVDFSSPVGASQ